MPELPEIEGMRGHLARRLVGEVIARIELAEFSALKTHAVPLAGLRGLEVDAVERRGKFLALGASGVHLAFHLARAGRIRWYDEVPPAPARPGKGPLALRFATASGVGFDLTEAGTSKRLAVYAVTDLDDVPGIARLGPDPLRDLAPGDLMAIFAAHPRTQLKGLLRGQSILAGVGNAYSDEILHAARLSPFKLAGSLTADEASALAEAVIGVLADAVASTDGVPLAELFDDKRARMRVHGRPGDRCAVCGDTIREVSFADSFLNYCPGCQTGGKLLADRRMSRLLK